MTSSTGIPNDLSAKSRASRAKATSVERRLVRATLCVAGVRRLAAGTFKREDVVAVTLDGLLGEHQGFGDLASRAPSATRLGISSLLSRQAGTDGRDRESRFRSRLTSRS